MIIPQMSLVLRPLELRPYYFVTRINAVKTLRHAWSVFASLEDSVIEDLGWVT